MRIPRFIVLLVVALMAGSGQAGYVNFEVSHVHPIDLTADGSRLLVVNTPDALLEVFSIAPDGSVVPEKVIPVGLEPVSVVARPDVADEAWVVNQLSDSVSIVDLTLGVVTRTLALGDEPTDVAFAIPSTGAAKAFVAVSEEDKIRVYELGDLDTSPTELPLFGRDVRALAVSANGQTVYAVVLKSGNQTSVINNGVVHNNTDAADPARLTALGLKGLDCEGHPTGAPPHPYPPLPSGVTRNAMLPDPPPDPPLGNPPVISLVVKWDGAKWVDEVGTDWSDCLAFRPADHDLFIIDVATLGVTPIKHLGTSLFEVSVQPGSDGKIYVPHTEARNFVPSFQHATQGSGRFEHPAGVRGRVVDNRIAVVDPSEGNAVTLIDLNVHVDRSTNPGPLAEREASISQPGMLVWNSDGSVGYLTAIGSRKVFRVDGSCMTDDCIFGANRSSPNYAVVGDGPTGAALLEDKSRLYVLNRISHSVSVVDTESFAEIAEVALHDPSSQATRDGRRFLYDAVLGSGHGDASCASCHISGDHDGMTWELGNPEEEFVSYSEPLDNVRFIGLGGAPCDPLSDPGCAARTGFDPQKGPMATQTLRGMLEPLHWRGDRATMRDFNGAFVALMGTADVGTAAKPKGLSDEEMEVFRQFALEMAFPPNPHRNVDDTLPCAPRALDPLCEVTPRGSILPGNPGEGRRLFDGGPGVPPTDGGSSCSACHTRPFGAAGGKLGGVEPSEPTSMDAAALFNGRLDLAIHSDMKVSHLRNMYERFGPVPAAPNDPPGAKPETKTTVGHIHDGSIPDLFRFLSARVFTLNAEQVRDIATFMFYFPTGIKPAVGRQVTLASGMPPTGSSEEEALLDDLVSLGDLASPDRHCELVASTVSGGRLRRYHLSGGLWVGDVAGEPAVSETVLRENAEQPLTFTCATILSGERLGGNRDEDVVLDGDDCAPGDPRTWRDPEAVTNLVLAKQPGTNLSWQDQTSNAGPSLRYEVLGGDLSALRSDGIGITGCVVGDLEAPAWDDTRPDPAPNDGFYYVVRAVNPCGAGETGRPALATLDCP